MYFIFMQRYITRDSRKNAQSQARQHFLAVGTR